MKRALLVFFALGMFGASYAVAEPRLVPIEGCYAAITNGAGSADPTEMKKCKAGIPIEDKRCLPGGYLYGVEATREYCTATTSKKANTQSASKRAKNGDGRAPYANGACVKHKPSGTGKVDWDYVRITNNCAFPVQVLSCYYKPGDVSKCNPRNGAAWGSSLTIRPGGRTTSIATTPDLPWMVSYYVCNMSGVKKHSKLCLLPKQ